MFLCLSLNRCVCANVRKRVFVCLYFSAYVCVCLCVCVSYELVFVGCYFSVKFFLCVFLSLCVIVCRVCLGL